MEEAERDICEVFVWWRSASDLGRQGRLQEEDRSMFSFTLLNPQGDGCAVSRYRWSLYHGYDIFGQTPITHTFNFGDRDFQD